MKRRLLIIGLVLHSLLINSNYVCAQVPDPTYCNTFKPPTKTSAKCVDLCKNKDACLDASCQACIAEDHEITAAVFYTMISGFSDVPSSQITLADIRTLLRTVNCTTYWIKFCANHNITTTNEDIALCPDLKPSSKGTSGLQQVSLNMYDGVAYTVQLLFGILRTDPIKCELYKAKSDQGRNDVLMKVVYSNGTRKYYDLSDSQP